MKRTWILAAALVCLLAACDGGSPSGGGGGKGGEGNTGPNRAPVANNDSVTLAEDTAANVSVLVNDNDADGDELVIASVTQGTHGSVDILSDTVVRYTPDADYFGSDSFTYSISDGRGGSAGATVFVNVTPVNDPPVAAADDAAVNEDGQIDVDVLANDFDVDHPSLTLGGFTQGAHGSVAKVGNKLRYTPVADWSGADSFSYNISDGAGATATGTVSITVHAMPDAPVAADDNAQTNQDVPVNIAVLDNDQDADGDVLTVTDVSSPSHGTVEVQADGSITYTPATGYHGADSFTYTVDDGTGRTDTAQVNITVIRVNAAPVAVDDVLVTNMNSAKTINPATNDTDVDGDTLTVISVTQPAHGTAVLNVNKTVTYTPTTGYFGADSFTYVVGDGFGGTDSGTVNVTVNAPPTANPDWATTTTTTTAATPVLIDVLSNDGDIDDGIITISGFTQPAHGVASLGLDKIQYTPPIGYVGEVTFTYTISDSRGATAQANVMVTVTVPSWAIASTTSIAALPDGSVEGAVVADFNNDGKPDVVFFENDKKQSDGLLNRIVVALNTTGQGALQFATSAVHTVEDAGFHVFSSVAAGDINGDGLADILFAEISYTGGHLSGRMVSVMLNNPAAPGTFLPRQQFDIGGSHQYPYAYRLATADMNGDGKRDIVAVNSVSDALSVLINTSATGSLDLVFELYLVPTLPLPTTLLITDLNLDGKPDLVTFAGDAATDTPNLRKLVVLLNTTTGGTFSTAQAMEFDLGDASWLGEQITVGDFDGNGMPDLIVSTRWRSPPTVYSKGRIALYRNLGTSGAQTISFSTVVLDDNIHANALGTADINKDGRLDFVLTFTTLAGNYVRVVGGQGLVNGQPSFGWIGTWNALQSGSTLAIADFNGDGILDVLFDVPQNGGGMRILVGK